MYCTLLLPRPCPTRLLESRSPRDVHVEEVRLAVLAHHGPVASEEDVGVAHLAAAAAVAALLVEPAQGEDHLLARCQLPYGDEKYYYDFAKQVKQKVVLLLVGSDGGPLHVLRHRPRLLGALPDEVKGLWKEDEVRSSAPERKCSTVAFDAFKSLSDESLTLPP